MFEIVANFFRYEHEKEQFEEFQRYSKEVEAELELELSVSNKKISELQMSKSRISAELDALKVSIDYYSFLSESLDFSIFRMLNHW